MFGETTIFHVKIWNHPIETTISNWLFGVPGVYVYIYIWAHWYRSCIDGILAGFPYFWPPFKVITRREKVVMKFAQIFIYTLEVNHHFKNSGSFLMMINPYYKKWWFGNQPIKKGGWTSRVYIYMYTYWYAKRHLASVFSQDNHRDPRIPKIDTRRTVILGPEGNTSLEFLMGI